MPHVQLKCDFVKGTLVTMLLSEFVNIQNTNIRREFEIKLNLFALISRSCSLVLSNFAEVTKLN